ncbi:MAG: hypothetical protein ACRYFX_11740 [Janthinobacterium lividum]
MSEHTTRRLLAAWLLVLGGVLLVQHLGWTQLAYWLLWAVALGCPVVAVLLLWLIWLRLREVWRRARVLWRAWRWRRK